VKYIEVEKKYALPDPNALKAKLIELGAKPSEPTHQVDEYFNHPDPDKDFLKPAAISEWVRVRTEARGSSVNYKCWHPVEAIEKTHADEFESAVGDVDAVRNLLLATGFTPLVTVDKIREAWTLPDVEIAFDHVEAAGHFVEFEFKGEFDNPEDAMAGLNEFIVSLGVPMGELIKRGYPHILLGREH
jgi:adenylate cyclase, class 2